MAMKDLLGSRPPARVGYAPSRVRRMLLSLLRDVQAKVSDGHAINLNRVSATQNRLAAEIQTALAMYDQLDALLAQVARQRGLIAKQVPISVHFIATVRSALRALEGVKPRRKLTLPEQALAVGRRLQTRQQLGTLGKRQRKQKLAASRQKP